MPYIGTSPSQGVRRVHTYTATANQTSFSGAGAEGATLSYKDSNFVDVYQNGVKLGDADYTATSGTAIVLGTGATVSDLVVIVAYDVFSAADTVSKADGGQFDGAVTFAGGVSGVLDVDSGITVDNITIDGSEIDLSSGDLTIDVAGDIILDADGGDFIFKDGGSGDEANKVIRFSTPSHDTDEENVQILQVESEGAFNQISFGGGTSALNASTKLRFLTAGVDTTTGVERISIDSSGNIVFNDTSVDSDFRVESNGNANMLFVDGGNDKIGIGLNSPNTSLHIRSSVASNIAGYRDGTTGLIVEGDAASYIQLVASKTNPMAILFDGGDTHNDTARGGLIYDIDTGLSIKSGGSTRWTINETGNLLPSATSLGIYLGVTSATASNHLDDYEEGTFTPSVGGNASYTSRVGSYVKIGRSVTINLSITINSIGTGSTQTITGIPFAAENESPLALAKATLTSSAFGDITARIAGSTLYYMTRQGDANQGTNTAIHGDGTVIQVGGSYRTT
jgi:prepilin-type processing-associated H-X9-DG protein